MDTKFVIPKNVAVLETSRFSTGPLIGVDISSLELGRCSKLPPPLTRLRKTSFPKMHGVHFPNLKENCHMLS